MEQNNFQWDENLIKEFVKEYNNEAKIKYVNGIDYYMDKFKASKTNPKEYEILSIRIPQLNVTSTSQIDIKNFLEGKLENAYIISIKRLSDNTVFSLGDAICFDGFGGLQNAPIERFEINYFSPNTISAYHSAFGIGLSKLKKYISNPILFTTTDGKDIYSEDKCYYINISEGYKIKKVRTAGYCGVRPSKNYIFYSTREAAEQYISWNKKQFSLSDIMAYSEWYSGNGETEFRKFLTDFLKIKSKTK